MWNKKNLTALYKLVTEQKLSFRQAGEKLNTTKDACRNRFVSTNWRAFFKNPRLPDHTSPTAWTRTELLELYKMRTKKPPIGYREIALRLHRDRTSCKLKFESTDWKKVLPENMLANAKQSQAEEKELVIKRLYLYLVELSRHNLARLNEISKKEFLQRCNMKESQLPVPFAKLKHLAVQELHHRGSKYPQDKQLGPGTYVIVGDSHGKHTKRGMFALLHGVCKHVGAKNIIHVGHMLDDDAETSYLWEDFKNLVVVGKEEELETLSRNAFKYDIVRTSVQLGGLGVSNQDIISDYVPTYIGDIKRYHFPSTTVVNLHRQELDTRTSPGENAQIASPGCLCERHIIKTIKQMDFTDGMKVRLCYPDSFIKYRRMRHQCNLWEQGLIVVHVNDDGEYDIVQCRIFRTAKGFATSYYDKIITETEVLAPHKKIFFNGDAHCDLHDPSVLDVQEQFCKDYRPDTVVNVGDVLNNKALNHHIMSRAGWAIPKDALDEIAHTYYVLDRMRKWAKEYHLLFGNHERFAKDFTEKFPQFAKLFDIRFMMNLRELGVNLTGHKRVLSVDALKFIHGDFKLFGAKGGQMLEKVYHTFGSNTVMGNVHFPSIRFGCYCVGLTGLLDQEYNEPSASRWMHGFGYCNVFEGQPFISLVHIKNNRCRIGDKTYSPRNPAAWTAPGYDAAIKFDFKDDEHGNRK